MPELKNLLAETLATMQANDRTSADKAGAVWFMQITDRPKDTTPEMVRAIAARFKNRHPIYEVANEPNFTFGPDDYFKLSP